MTPQPSSWTKFRSPSLARLPALRWQSLAAWLQIEMPFAAMPANAAALVALRLVRSTDEREPELLLTSLENFKLFSQEAALVRLERLQFAADAQGNVLVQGRPLPPLPGRRFVGSRCGFFRLRALRTNEGLGVGFLRLPLHDGGSPWHDS